MEETIEKRKESVIKWLKNPLNLSLTLILIIGFALRLYYFLLTKNQPLWWDELSYGSMAKNFVSGQWSGTPLITGEMAIRPLILSYLWAFLLLLNFGEVANRFILIFIPSVLSIFSIYLVGKEIHNKRTGVIAAAIFAVSWFNLFYSSRFLVHMLEINFLAFSLYFFVKSTKTKINLKQFSISLIFLSLATLTRFQDGLVFLIYFLILILGKKLYLNKIKFWYASMIGLMPLFLFFIINYFTQGNIFPALFGDYNPTGDMVKELPFAFFLLKLIPTFLGKTFLIFFFIGLLYLLFEIVLGYNLLAKNSRVRNSIILILLIIVFFSFFIFYLKGGEDRWLYEVFLAMTLITGFSIDLIASYLEKYNKILGVLMIIIILLIGGYGQISMADPLIKQKSQSFLQIRQGFEWIKQNTPEGSVIVGSGIEPYAVYYAERNYNQLFNNESDIKELENAEYIVYQSFTPQSEYLRDYIIENQNELVVMNAFFFDSQKTRLAVIIYNQN